MDKFWDWLCYVIIAVILITVIGRCSPRDDTDPVDGPRSGVIPVRDALTGCEYLRTPFGGITPRMDNTGKQVCRIRYTKELSLGGAP